MFASAAQRLAEYVPRESFAAGTIYPELSDLRDISLKVRRLLHRFLSYIQRQHPPGAADLRGVCLETGAAASARGWGAVIQDGSHESCIACHCRAAECIRWTAHQP